MPLLTGGASLAEVRELAQDLMTGHGLHDWDFAYNRRKNSLGYCWFDSRTIELSIFFVQRNCPDAVRETLLHEIAHALVGPGYGHGPVWQAKAREVGARPERLGRADMPAGRWQARCNGCGGVHHRHRKPKFLTGWYCLRCGEDRGELVWQLA